MALTPEQIAEAALRLPLKERVELAEKLVSSLEEIRSTGEQLVWGDETKAEILKGLAQLARGEFVDWDPSRIRVKGRELLKSQSAK